jgi:hypothetical protein
MRWGYIRNSDNLFRHCIHPVSFKSGRFASGRTIKLYPEPDGALLASLVWQRFVPTTELLHDDGCRLADRINENERIGGRYREKNKKSYCGAYQIKADAVRALPTELDEIIFADVLHHIEEGEIAHADLIIVLKLGNDLNIEGTKTAIVDRLWNSFSGPLKHSCDGDKETEPHPSSILPIAPKGEYADNRSRILRLWSITKYKIYNLLWQVFFRNGN